MLGHGDLVAQQIALLHAQSVHADASGFRESAEQVERQVVTHDPGEQLALGVGTVSPDA